MKTITFYSYKGGVGRTLLLANLAKRLAEVGKTVCILDFNLEAPSSTSKFGFAKFGTEAKIGLVDYIYDFQENKKLPKTIETTELFTTYADKFYLIKAGDSSNADYWKKLLKISWNKLFYEQDSQGIEFLLYFKDLIKKQINPDYLLIDTRTGITEIASITISLFADEVVMLSSNNKDSLEGSKQVLKTITNKENIYNDVIPNIYFILSRLPHPKTINEIENEKRIISQHLYELNQNLIENHYELKEENLKIIHSDRKLELREELKIGYGFENEDVVSSDYHDIFNLIFRKYLSNEELENFYSIKESDHLVQRALLAEKKFEEFGFEKPITLLNKATEKNPENRKAYYHLAIIYNKDGNYEKAIKLIDKAMDENFEDYFTALYIKLFILFNLNKLAEIDDILSKIENRKENQLQKIFLDVKLSKIRYEYFLTKSNQLSNQYMDLIKKYPNICDYYNSFADYLRKIGNYEEGIRQLNHAFELYSEYALGYATLAEIYASQNKEAEFYRNFELALKFKLDSTTIFSFDVVDVYEKYFSQERFIKLLDKYNYNYAIKRIKKYLGQDANEDNL